MTVTLIVTDLDGSLLDHDTYSYQPAATALAEIRRREIPLILASSKTRAEMELLHAELQLATPFICENGAAICTPAGDGFELEAMAPPRAEILAILAELREREGFRFTGFADSDAQGIAGMTGLDPEAAALAGRREFSEPLRWEDSPERLEELCRELSSLGLRAQQGGRFLSVAGPADKGRAVERLRRRYDKGEGVHVIALGDSPNDASMLSVADVAVIIASARSGEIEVSGPGRVIRTDKPGPVGWQEAIWSLLSDAETIMTG